MLDTHSPQSSTALSAVLGGFTIDRAASTDEATVYRYSCPDTCRRFEVLEHHVDGLFFLREFAPNGRVFARLPSGEADCRVDPRILDALVDVGPNRLIATVAGLGLHRDRLVWDDGPGGLYPIRYATLADCARVVVAAISADVRYRSQRVPSDAERQAMALRVGLSMNRYRAVVRSFSDASWRGEAGLFQGCHTMHGPLAEPVKWSILSYLNLPASSLWLDIRNQHITSGLTLWQAWVAVDAAAPRGGHGGYPSPVMLRRAIRYAAAQSRDFHQGAV